MYEDGRGVPQSYAEAVKWYRLGAEQGDVWAQYFLGLMYEEGHDVTQDYVEAHKWYNLAASKWIPADSDLLDLLDSARKITRKMTREEVATAQRLAIEWQPKTWNQLKAE